MSLTRLLPCVIIVLISCTNDKSFQTEERVAMSGIAVPLFANETAIRTNAPFKTLAPGTPVYLTDDIFTNDTLKLVRVVWGDSTAYAPRCWLMLKGKLAVITSQKNIGITMYSDPELTAPKVELQRDWMLAVVGPPQGDATPVRYHYSLHAETGFVPTSNVFSDALSVDFYNEYEKLNGDPLGLTELQEESKYKKLAVYTKVFGVTTMNEDESEFDGAAFYADGINEPMTTEAFLAESGWVRDSVQLTDNESPGTFKKYFELTGGGEIDADGYGLANVMPFSSTRPFVSKTVKRVRFEFIPNKKCTVRFVAEGLTDSPDPSIPYRIFEEEFVDAEADRPYVVYQEDNDDVLCNNIRVTVEVNKARAIATVSGTCGD